ncbi:MAG: site-specific integrase, partial [Clostridiaceae bacterium]|nr:site-specific integrase [Clostridiaceae bacterium]
SMRKPGTGCISEINDHLFEGRYSPVWPDGKKHARNVYAKTRAECEEKVKVLIAEMKAEIADLRKRQANKN